jgi:uncharacterized membrane protein (DUF106 family)
MNERGVQGPLRCDLLYSDHQQKLPVPAASLPGKTPIMLIILIAIAVIFSVFAELFYGYFADRHQLSWVRPEVNEHAAIMRQLGRMRSNRFEF